MQDLTHLYPNGPVSALAPTSQAAGNMSASNARAMTAPGTQPVDILRDREVQVDPSIESITFDTPVLVGESGASVTPDNADRSNPFTENDSAGWRSAQDDIPVGKTLPRIQLGGWNNL